MMVDKPENITIKKPILVVDDSLVMKKLVKNMFKEYNIENYEIVEDGLTAIEKVKQKKYAIAIVDILLPGLDGISVIAKMREMDSKLPVVVLTALLDKKIKDQCKKLGIKAYITKPFTFETVMDAVYKYSR